MAPDRPDATPSADRPHPSLAPKSLPPPATGLVRERLLEALESRIGVLLAPAGHGKTTVLAQLAARSDGPVAWYRADATDRSVDDLVDGLRSALFRCYGIDGPARTCAELARALDGSPVSSALLVVDDFHELAGSPASDAVLRLVELAPASLRVLIASRGGSELDSTLLRLSGHTAVVDADDLRFRSWEVEQLFREVLGRPLPADDAAALTARTEGWPAGLTLFHLVTAERSPVERREALARLGRSHRLVREYLAREVLGDLPEPLRDFLRRTSALGVLTGALCDALLGREQSGRLLADLHRRQLVTGSGPDGDRFRYHQALQDHLEVELAESLGPAGATAWYRRAAGVLRAGGEFRAAFRALVLAEDWSELEVLLHDRGEQVVSSPLGDEAGALPRSLAERDPWLMLARARGLAARGRLEEAVSTYRRAAQLAGGGSLVTLCAEEQAQYARWLPGAGAEPVDWAGVVAGAVSGSPAQAYGLASPLRGAEGRLACAATALLAGDPAAAAVHFDEAGQHPQAGSAVVRAAVYGRALADLVRPGGGPPGPSTVRLLERTAAADPSPWWGRVGRALLHAGRAETDLLAPLVESADLDRDSWGGAVILLLQGICTGSAPTFVQAAERFDAFRARVPAHWARCLAHAATTTAEPDPGPVSGAGAGTAARALERAGKQLGAADVLAAARAWAGPRDAPATSPAPPGRAAQTEERGSAVELQLLGRFRLRVGGRPVDLRSLRPRVRSTLYLLACHAGSPVHRDVLTGALWPDAAPEAGYRSLQVAVSTLRGVLEAAAGQASADLLPRSGDAYLLRLEGGGSDLAEFEAAVAAARQARLDGREGEQAAALRAALDVYGGDLLPELGNADWVLEERQRLRIGAADAAATLAGLEAEAGRTDAALDLLRRALALDRFRDSAWQQLADLHRQRGDLAAAEATRGRHRQVLADLGLLPAARQHRP